MVDRLPANEPPDGDRPVRPWDPAARAQQRDEGVGAREVPPAGWAPAPGGPPPAVPGWPPIGYDPNDPLVTPPGADLAGWFARAVAVVRRSWRVLVPVLLITHALPALVFYLALHGADPTRDWATEPVAAEPPLGELFNEIASYLALVVGAGAVFALAQAVGWAAGTWVITRQALGEPATVAAALRYGVRRAAGLWGWILLTYLLISVGVFFCVLPGVYLAFALSMVGPVYLFERRVPLGRSFGFLRSRPGLLLGRTGLVAVALIVWSLGTAMVQEIGLVLVQGGLAGVTDLSVGSVLVYLLVALLGLPASVVSLVGLLLTYTEQRAHEAPTSTAALATELG